MNKYVIAGERRCGTSSVLEFLKSHNIFAEHILEDSAYPIPIKYFSKSKISDLPIESYEFSETKDSYKNADLFWFSSLENHELDISNKYIYIIRNPIDRLKSQYKSEFFKGRELLGFNKALQRNLNNQKSYNIWELLHLDYINRGLYSKTLTKVTEVNKDLEFHIVVLENLLSNTIEEIDKIFNFLDIQNDLDISRLKRVSNSDIKNIKSTNPLINYYIRTINSFSNRFFQTKFKKERFRNFFLRPLLISENKIIQKEDLIVPDSVIDMYRKDKIILEKIYNLDLSLWDF